MRKKDWALITGASAGIGTELARVFAEQGWNLLLTGRNEERLRTLATALEAACGIQARTVAMDLAEPEGASRLKEAVKEPITALVNNAGFGSYGPFAESSYEKQTSMVQVNVMALMQLTRLFLPEMQQRREGYILNVASTAAFQPGPTMAVYYASKAFVFSFTYALAAELEESGVSATALCPGLTRSEFIERANLREHGRWPMMDPRAVALAGYRGMLRRKRVVVPGWYNRITSMISPCLPVRWTSAMARKVHEP
jgi:short-subunit dehydrogenase